MKKFKTTWKKHPIILTILLVGVLHYGADRAFRAYHIHNETLLGFFMMDDISNTVLDKRVEDYLLKCCKTKVEAEAELKRFGFSVVYRKHDLNLSEQKKKQRGILGEGRLTGKRAGGILARPLFKKKYRIGLELKEGSIVGVYVLKYNNIWLP